MSTSAINKAPPASTPARELALEEQDMLFPPSAELGEQLQHLEHAQAEIDRKHAEELARLREIQDRD